MDSVLVFFSVTMIKTLRKASLRRRSSGGESIVEGKPGGRS